MGRSARSATVAAAAGRGQRSGFSRGNWRNRAGSRMLRGMKILALLVVAPICVALAGCAGQTYRVDAGAMFAKTKGDIALQNAPGTLVLADNENNVDSNLGVGDTEVSPYLRLQSDYELHRFRIHGFGINAEGTGTLVGDYGDLAGGSVVSSSMDLWAVAAAWAYELERTEDYRFAVGAQLGY